MDRPMPDDRVYHGPLGKIVKAMAPHSEADPIGLLASLMTLFGHVTSGTAHIKLGARKHTLRQFTALAGVSGDGKKGTATGEAGLVVEAALPFFLDTHTTYGIKSGPGLIDSIHKVSQRNGGDTDTRLYCEIEEMSGLMEMLKREASLSAVLCKAWDGGNLSSDTKKDPVFVRNALVTFLGNVQPDIFRRAVRAKDVLQGAWNRFMFFYVHSPKILDDDESLTEDMIAELGEQLAPAIEFGQQAEEITLSPKAAAWWKPVKREMRSAKYGNEFMTSFTKRSSDHVVRAAGLYALADQRGVITLADIKAAKALVDYTIESIMFVMGDVDDEMVEDDNVLPIGDPKLPANLEHIERLWERLKHAPEGGLAATPLRTPLRMTADELEEAAGHLKGHIVRYSKPGTTGTPKKMLRAIDPTRTPEVLDQGSKLPKIQRVPEVPAKPVRPAVPQSNGVQRPMRKVAAGQARGLGFITGKVS